jgi:hypothetical protein
MSQREINVLNDLLEYIANPPPTNLERRLRRCIICNRNTVIIQRNGSTIRLCPCINPTNHKP